ncbi:MFS transporter [Actinomadura nitritigenes]|uniref:MFS transporter n=1 Tax=Actinomadura nitritigenes TaxID=134602 RepID=UPI003D92FAD3
MGEPPRPAAGAGDAGAATLPGEPDPPLRRNRDFLLLWSGAGLSLLGTRINTIAYPLLVLWSTGSARTAGLLGFVAQLPYLVVQLPAGALVDRWDRRRLMILCNAGAVLATAGVAATVAAGRLWLPVLLVAAFAESALGIVYRLAERAGVRTLVPPRQLATALSQNEARGQTAGLLGQPGGGLLFGLAHWAPFGFTALAHLGSVAGLLLIRRDLSSEPAARPSTVAGAIGEAVVWVWRQRLLRAVLGIVAAGNLLLQGLGLALLVAVHEQGGSPAMVSLIVAGRGLGGVLGALSGTWWLRRLSVRAIVIGGNAAWAALIPAAALAPGPLWLGPLFAGVSFVAGVLNVAGGVYQVRTTPDAMQGRVGGVMGLVGSGTTALGMLGAGLMLGAQGAAPTLLELGGAMTAVALLAIASPAVRRARDRL